MDSNVSRQQNPRSVKNMVNVIEVYPQYSETEYTGDDWNYLNSTNIVSENLNNTPLTIKSAEVKRLGQGEEAKNKIVLSFNETSKQLALNRSNGSLIAERFGDNTDLWTGKQISLLVVKKNFAGKLVDGIQVVTL
jgi:hypothetical protein